MDGTEYVNNWHYYTVTYDGSGNATGVKFYIDGIEQVRKNLAGYGSNTTATLNDFNPILGGEMTKIHCVKGVIDEFRVYKKELTGTEVQNLYVVEGGTLSVTTGIIKGRITCADGTAVLPGTIVEIISSSVTVLTAVVGQDGMYEFILAPGVYELRVSSSGYQQAGVINRTISQGTAIMLNFALNNVDSSGKPDLKIVGLIPETTAPVLNQPVSVSIVIKNDSNVAVNTPFWVDLYENLTQSPVLSQAGNTFNTVNSIGAGSTMTVTASFVYKGGTYNLYAQIDGDNTVVEENETNNTYGPVLIAEQNKAGVVTGKIVSRSDGKPIQDIIVTVKQNSVVVSSMLTDITGDYTVTLVSGSYTFEINAAGYKSTATIVTVIPFSTVYKDFVLVPSSGKGVLLGVVTRTDGVTTVPDVTIKIIDSNTQLLVITIKTNFVGTYRLLLSTGTYHVSVEGTGYKTQTQTNVVITEDQTTMVDFSLEYLYQPPEPVADLEITPLDNSCAFLSWIPSVSDGVQYYRIYYSTGTIDYASLFTVVRATADVSAHNWVSPILDRGVTYNFSVRPVNSTGIENLDTGNIVKLVPMDNSYSVKAVIKVPQTGKKVSGNRLTVVAEVIANPDDCSAVRFEYKPAYSDKWLAIPVPADETVHLNPDTIRPYFIHWDLTVPNGLYDIRAVTINDAGEEDMTPISVTIAVNNVDYEVSEGIMNGVYQKKEKVSNKKETSIKVGKSDDDILTEVIVTSGTLVNSNDVVNVSLDPVLPTAKPVNGLGNIINSVDVKLDSGQSMLNKTMEINIPYSTSNDGKIVIDGVKTDKTADDLEVWSYSDSDRLWKKEHLVENDRYNKKLQVMTSHLSIFAIVVSNVNDLADVKVFPSPFKKKDGNTKMTFSGLSGKDVTIKIFTVSGELVFKQEGVIAVSYDWPVTNDEGKDVASGVYLYHVKDTDGNKATGKFAVIK
jgi:hypothetical protein